MIINMVKLTMSIVIYTYIIFEDDIYISHSFKTN